MTQKHAFELFKHRAVVGADWEETGRKVTLTFEGGVVVEISAMLDAYSKNPMLATVVVAK